MQSEHLNSAPVKEAIIEFRFSSQVSLENLRSLETKLPTGYNKLQPVIQSEIGITFQDGELKGNNGASKKIKGYRSDNNEINTVAIFESDRFVFSKLAPYSNWDDFKQHAANIWQLYKLLQENVAFTRIATRFVNEIKLPLIDEKLEFDDYLTTCPKIPANMPDILIRFFSKISIPCIEERSIASVTLSSGEIQDSTISIILDIDVFRDGLSTPSENELWCAMDVLRDIRNKSFFGSITEKTRGLLK